MKKIVKISMMAIALALPVTGVNADSLPPFPEFTFKTGKPPKAGAGKRITVQIEPGDQAAAAPKPEAADTGPGRVAQYAWFWDHIPAGY